jgi:uncharacterized membrane protein
MEMKYHQKQLAAELVHMAVTRVITIDYQKGLWGGTYSLKKIAKTRTPESEPYRQIYDTLFSSGTEITLSSKHQKKLEAAIQSIKKYYKNACDGFFSPQYHLSILPALGFFASVLLAVIIQPLVFEMTQLTYFIVLGGIAIISRATSFLRSYTDKGLAVRSEILGFKMFLEATEKERLKIIGTPPTKTPELYEKYLPYAIALNVEEQWSRQFAPLFAELEKQGTPYLAAWYIGTGTFRVNTFTSNISTSLPSASQTSGFGGGGSGGAGGGRGGGGGGSW